MYIRRETFYLGSRFIASLDGQLILCVRVSDEKFENSKKSIFSQFFNIHVYISILEDK